MFVSQGTATLNESPQEIPSFSPTTELPRGCLVEISGSHAHWEAARILAENRQLPAAWIEQDLSALPEKVFKSGMDFSRVLFINGKKDSSWAASAIVESGLFPILVYSAPYNTSESFLRRLRRQAHASRTTVILLNEAPCFSWTIRVQVRAEANSLSVLRWRRQ